MLFLLDPIDVLGRWAVHAAARPRTKALDNIDSACKVQGYPLRHLTSLAMHAKYKAMPHLRSLTIKRAFYRGRSPRPAAFCLEYVNTRGLNDAFTSG